MGPSAMPGLHVVRIEQASDGMILATDIEVGGRLLLRAGVRLTSRHVSRLRTLGIRTLYVTDGSALCPGACTHSSLLTRLTRRAAYRVMRRQLALLAQGFAIQSRPVFRVVDAIVRDVLADPQTILQLAEIRAMGDYLFTHSISVAATAVLVGFHSGLEQGDLRALAVGALLHDVGKVRLPEGLWTKPGMLTEEEYRQIQQHTILGYETLRQEPAFDVSSVQVAYQHHERWDGSGYPQGLAGEGIHRFARIVAVVDVFDALTTDRPHRPAWQRDLAIAYVQDQAGAAFDPAVARTFLARVAPYPVGCWVRLNTGEVAQVVAINPGLPGRPLIRVQSGFGCGTLAHELIDLAQDLARRIVGPVATGRPRPPQPRPAG